MTFYLSTYPQTRRWVEYRGTQEHGLSLGVNVREEDDAYLLTALVPGLQAEDLNIQVLDDVVAISGEFKPDESDYLVRELPHGAFQRSLRLPVALNADGAEARITDGVLNLRVPKAESARPKTIKVKTK